MNKDQKESQLFTYSKLLASLSSLSGTFALLIFLAHLASPLNSPEIVFKPKAKKLKIKSWVKTLSKLKLKKPKATAKKKKKEKEEEDKQIKGQVVENSPAKNSREAPKKTKLLSRYNSKVKKQSLAKNRTLLSKRHASKSLLKKKNKQKAKSKKPAEIKPVIIAKAQKDAPAKKSAWGEKSNEPLKKESLLKRKKLRLKVPDEKLLSMLDPNGESGDSSLGAPFADFVEDIEEGDETLLNTREFKYASFFSRLKTKVGPIWHSKINHEIRRRDPTRKVYLTKKRTTVLSVSLGRDGKLIDTKVVKSSGVNFIDRAAIFSFQNGAPFPNPPKGMVNGDGVLFIKFGFVIHVDAPPLYDLFR